MTDLRELEKRLEMATGSAFALDVEIMRVTGYARAPFENPPAFTDSIDAAVALVERVLPDWHVSIQGVNQAWSARLTPTAFGKAGNGFANHKTNTLALCLALIRALIAKGERHD